MTKHRRRVLLGLALGIVVCLVVIHQRGRLPPLDGRTVSAALSDAQTAETRLAKFVRPHLEAHPGLSGIHPLRDARDAFAARMRLVEAAERSLDIQYYIWHEDLTGTLLFDAVRTAADRGVRVRILLDDINTSGLDEPIAALDSHPNVEIRLFNPFVIRKPRGLGYLTDFSRLNRRMHNKSFTADNRATIVGGRNVGDEYFGATDGVWFADLDVLAVGPVVREVSESFDRYWASASAYPAQRIVPAAPPDRLASLAAEARRIERSPEAEAYMRALRDSAFLRDLASGTLDVEWAVARAISDDPAKGLGRGDARELVSEKLRTYLGVPASDLKLVSPYFVPGSTGTEWLADLARRGVRVQVLTNSLEATDVAFVHAGYAKRRLPLLRSGVTLFELERRGDGASPAARSAPGSATGSGRSGSGSGGGSSLSSLHAKTFAVDHARVFIGSFNFDRRSISLNTEMGIVIESPRLAAEMDRVFRDRVPRVAYEVRMGPDGRLLWLERRDGKEIRAETEPGTTRWRRGWVRFLSFLPIDWLL
jgi:putative cardiolipin synthase